MHLTYTLVIVFGKLFHLFSSYNVVVFGNIVHTYAIIEPLYSVTLSIHVPL